MNKEGKLHLLGNILGLVVICIILSIVFIDQFIHHDLPCPLCLLQRVCFIAIGLCMLMNLQLGLKPSHYGLMILSTLLGLAVSVRQISLHLAPNDPGYGMTFLGVYFYTWAAICFGIILIFIAIALLFDNDFKLEYKIHHLGYKVLVAFFLFLILADGVSTFIQCGPYVCPSDPTQYFFFSSNAGL